MENVTLPISTQCSPRHGLSMSDGLGGKSEQSTGTSCRHFRRTTSGARSLSAVVPGKFSASTGGAGYVPLSRQSMRKPHVGRGAPSSSAPKLCRAMRRVLVSDKPDPELVEASHRVLARAS